MRVVSLAVLVSTARASFVGAYNSDVGQTIQLRDGSIVGNARDAAGILSFMSIPYARPPVGDLRWTNPAPSSPWTSTLNATQFGWTCWNNLVGGPAYTPYNEDCLTVNVWTGASQKTEKRPVMVWIYGGGFQFGASADPLYNGSLIAQEGVILVTFNYRLGVFGFLALEELDGEGHNSGDFGLSDQLAALRWVKENIGSFGGDPDNVTIFGESAGAHAIGLLMASPLSQGLIHKAIIESGAWWDRIHGSLTTFVEARQYGLNFEKKLGGSNVADLRNLSAQVINNAQPFNLNQDPGITGFAPSVDDYVVPVPPGQAFHDSQELMIPLLAGFNADEQYLFLGNALPHQNSTQYESAAAILFGDRLPQFLSLYPDDTIAVLNASADALVGDLFIREQTWEAAEIHSRAGNSVYLYYYNYTSIYEPIASHIAEEPFVFGNLLNNPLLKSFTTPIARDRIFSQHVMAYWTNFAKQGNPNGAGLPVWPEYNGSTTLFELGNTIAPLEYNLSRYQFIETFRTNGVLPATWRNLNVSASSV